MSAKNFEETSQDFPVHVSSHPLRTLEAGGQTSITLTALFFQIGAHLRTACIGHCDSCIEHRTSFSFFDLGNCGPWISIPGTLTSRIAFAILIKVLAGRSEIFLGWLGTWTRSTSLAGHYLHGRCLLFYAGRMETEC